MEPYLPQLRHQEAGRVANDLYAVLAFDRNHHRLTQRTSGATMSYHIRRLHTSEWRAYRDVRLRSLAESPDAFGSTLEVEDARSDEEWKSRVSAGALSALDLPLGLWQDDRLVGLAWGKVFPNDPDTAHLFQMWVAPEARGEGLGAKMLAQIIEWAAALGVARLVLGVTQGDTPARRLYERAGFEAYGDLEPLRPGSELQSQKMLLELKGHVGNV